MKGFGIFLIILSIVAFIACGVFANQSFDKYNNYYYSDSYYYRNVNAYVGGDAYNYIINGTYFTAFAIYSVGCGIAGIILLALGGLLIGIGSRSPQITAIPKAEAIASISDADIPKNM